MKKEKVYKLTFTERDLRAIKCALELCVGTPEFYNYTFNTTITTNDVIGLLSLPEFKKIKVHK